jgi:membrane protease YdiL (CAAX protease family)
MNKEAKGFRDWVQEHRLQWGVVLVLILWLSRVLSVIFLPQWFKPFNIYETPSFTLLLLVWFILLSVGLVGGGIVWLTRTSWRELGWRREGLVKAIGLGVLGYILTFVSLIPIIMIQGGGAGQSGYASPSVARFLLVTFFAFGIPAWVEENLFRGYLQPLLAQRVNLWMAIVIQAAIFSAAHLGYASGLLQFVWLFVSGLIYGWLRGRNGSLVASFLAHGLGWMVLVFGPAAF